MKPRPLRIAQVMMIRFSQARASSTVRPDLEKFIIRSAIAAVTTAAMVEIVRICVYTSFMISFAFSHTVVAAKAGIVPRTLRKRFAAPESCGTWNWEEIDGICRALHIPQEQIGEYFFPTVEKGA